MIDLEADILDELEDFEDDDQEDIFAIVNHLVYQALENARDTFAASTQSDALREKILNAEIVMEDESHGYLDLDNEAEELLRIEEEGVPPFSIREAMLNSPSVKTSKQGLRYVVIPFRGNNRGVNPLRLGSLGYQSRFALGTSEGFRTLSDKSSLGAWQHPGIPAHAVYESLKTDAQRDLDESLREVMEDYQ